MDLVSEKNLPLPKTQISRRAFLQLAGTLGTAAVAGSVIEFLREVPERKVDPYVLEKEKKDDLGLGELGKTRSEYFALWPYSRIWVVANNLIAASKLDGIRLNKGQEYSLVGLLKLADNFKNNTNPEHGYITGTTVSLRAPFVQLAESMGVSLTATAFARSAALSPVSILEWTTHADSNNSVMKNYFNPEYQFTSNDFFQNEGTDATVYTSNSVTHDFRFTPKTDLTIKYKIMDIDGRTMTLPDMIDRIRGYAGSPFTRFTTPILLRVAFGSREDTRHSVTFTKSYTEEYDGRIRLGFVRELRMGGEQVSREKIQALYDTNGIYMP